MRHRPRVMATDDSRLDDLRLLAKAGKGPSESSRYLGVHICTIRSWAKIAGISFGSRGSYMRTHWTPAYRAKFMENRWTPERRAEASERMAARHRAGMTGLSRA